MDEVRFDHCIPYLGNGSYDIVFNIQLPPASIERIVITMDGNDSLDLVSDMTAKNSWPSAVTAISVSDKTDDSLLKSAKRSGLRQGMLEGQKDNESSADMPTPEELHTRAQKSSAKYLEENWEDVEKSSYDPLDDIAPSFENEYIRAYKSQRAPNRDVEKLVLPDKFTSTALKKARTDQKKAKKRLSLDEIKYQAAIRAQEYLRLDTSNDINYLDSIKKFAVVYEDAYQVEDTPVHEEVEPDRFRQSRSFL